MTISYLGFYLLSLLSLLYLLPLQWKTIRIVTPAHSQGPGCGSLSPCAHYLHLHVLATLESVTKYHGHRGSVQECGVGGDTNEPLRKPERVRHCKVQPPAPRLSLPVQLRDEYEAKIGVAPSLDTKPHRFQGARGHDLAPEVIPGVVSSLTIPHPLLHLPRSVCVFF